MPMGKIIFDLIQTPIGDSFVKEYGVSVKNTLRTFAKTRCQTYFEVNSDLNTSLISPPIVLKTGRWSRLPRDSRLCECGEIQTEHHVLFSCVKTQYLGDQFVNVRSCRSLDDLLSCKHSEKDKGLLPILLESTSTI